MQVRFLLSLAGFSALLQTDLRALQRAPASCDRYVDAVRADPNNVDAAVSLGQCSVRDYEMIAPAGDSARLAFRSSWSVALRALRHAVAANPANSRAYRPLFRILFAETRDGCSSVTGQCLYVSPVRRDGDSIVTIPRLVRLNAPGVDTYEEVARESRASQRASLEEARALAERWAAIAPNDARPREYVGRALLLLRDPEAASVELERAAALGTPASRRALFWDRFEALVRSNQGTAARRVLDEAASDPERDTTQLRALTIASLNALLGRYRPPEVDSARVRLARARLDSVLRSRPPAPVRERGFSELRAAGDTAGARRVLAQLDSFIAPRSGEWRGPPFGPSHVSSAEYHLALGDTTFAESRLAEIENMLIGRRFEFNLALRFSDLRPWMGRAWALSGDVAAARGRRDEASRLYRRVIGLWSGGDPEAEVVVDRARASLSALSRQ